MSKINISIDDVSPHPYASTKVLARCFEVIKEVPQVKFSLFIPIAYWRTIKPNIATEKALQINFFPKFCEEIRNLPDANFEICYHGFYHGIPGVSDNDEFQNLRYDQAIKRFEVMFEVVRMANLQDKFKKIFRPPAWRMSPEAIQACRDLGFKVLALSSKDYAMKTYKKKESEKQDVVFYNCNPPFDELKIYNKTEIVYHSCEWDKNYLCEEKTNNLIDFLKKHKDDSELCFLGDML